MPGGNQSRGRGGSDTGDTPRSTSATGGGPAPIVRLGLLLVLLGGALLLARRRPRSSLRSEE